MQSTEYSKIKYVKPLENYRLFIIFENGAIKLYSLLPKLQQPAFKALENVELFNSVQSDKGGYGIIWNDDIDLSEYELWKNGVLLTSIETLTKNVMG